mgnify:CR=1 FL=1
MYERSSKEYICEFCNQPFLAKRTARFCSKNCSNKSNPDSSKKRKEWYKTYISNPENRLKVNKTANDRAIKIRRWLDEYKIQKSCIDCGFNLHPCALHFDHITGEKDFNVCNAKSIQKAKEEIKKCVVRCANCHAIKTWTNHLT